MAETNLDNVNSQPNPLVSVIIPAYNAAPFIGRTLRSVLDQTHQHIEVLVVDDGSTDATADIVKQFAADDRRVSLHQQSNAGVAAARNHGIEVSSGSLIAPLDADDTWAETNLEKQVSALSKADASTALVYAWSIYIDAADRLTGGVRISPYYGNIYPALLYKNIIGNASACLIRRSTLESVGGYDSTFVEQQAQGCEDWDLYLRIAKHHRVQVVPELLIGYRQVTGSMSSQIEAMARSRALTFQPVREGLPAVYQKVSRWCNREAYMYTAKQAFKQNKEDEAWAAIAQALKNDWLVTLTTYNNLTLLLQLLWRYIVCKVGLGRDATLSQKPHYPSSPLPAPDVPTKLPIKLYLRLLLSPLFPGWVVQRLRLHWVTSKVQAQRPRPKSLSLWTVNKPRMEVQLRSQQPNCRVDYGRKRSPKNLNIA